MLTATRASNFRISKVTGTKVPSIWLVEDGKKRHVFVKRGDFGIISHMNNLALTKGFDIQRENYSFNENGMIKKIQI